MHSTRCDLGAKMTYFLYIILCVGIILIVAYWKAYQRRPWLWNYIKFRIGHRAPNPKPGEPIHILFLFVDHFEPKENCSDPDVQMKRIERWFTAYPEMASKFRDADGYCPRHTWFYQVEDWEHSDLDFDYLNKLSQLCFQGYGEVELHIHHNQPEQGYFPEVNTGEKLEKLIEDMKAFFSQNGALITAEEKPRRTYGFIHGMFALDNSHEGIYCGVNDEFQILRKTGCYADFTMPAGVYVAQSKKINSIYYVIDDPKKPRSHDTGVDVEVGKKPVGDLMTIQGPLWVNVFDNLKIWDVTVENANVDHNMSPSKKRVDKWIKTNIHVKGNENWVFVKIHTHGSREDSFPIYFGKYSEEMYHYLIKKYNDGKNYVLHFVTAREAYNIIKAAEAGKKGNPNQYRNFMVKPYANTKILTRSAYQLQTYSPEKCAMKILDQKDDISIIFKELLITEFHSQWLSYFRYSWDSKNRKINLFLKGMGWTKASIKLPSGDFESIKIENAKIVGHGAENHNIITIASELVGNSEKEIRISY